MRPWLAIAALVALPAVAIAQEPRLRRAEAAVRDQLRDPDSARFHGTYARGGEVCGLVNARNGYGGYSGFVPFIVYGNGRVIVFSMAAGEPAERLCPRGNP